MVRRERRRDRVAVEQFARDAGVFTGDQVGAGEGLQRAQGDVAEIADWRGNEIQPRRKPRTLDRLVGNDEAADGAVIVVRIVAGCVANREAHCRHSSVAFAKRHSRAKFIIFFIWLTIRRQYVGLAVPYS